MKPHRIAVIAGDGVGPEVVEEGLKVMKAAQSLPPSARPLAFEKLPWGSEYYLRSGTMMPKDALEILDSFDAIYLGAIGDPRLPDAVTLHGLILPIRKAFDQYACVRPAYLYPGISSPLASKAPGSIDMIVIRENTSPSEKRGAEEIQKHIEEMSGAFLPIVTDDGPGQECEIEKIKSSREEVRRERDSLYAQVETMKADIHRLAADRDRTEKQRDSLQVQIFDLENKRIPALEAQISKLRQMVVNLGGKIDTGELKAKP